MPRQTVSPIHLSPSERAHLEKLVKRPSTAQQIALRAQIVLRAGDGQSQGQIARDLDISQEMARRWRRRWLALTPTQIPVVERLQDAPRPGAPATFTLEQITQLYALACAPPEQYGRPISHWTAQELADELQQQQIIESISSRHVGRLLAEAELKPHQRRYWLHPPPTQSSKRKSRTSATSINGPRPVHNRGS